MIHQLRSTFASGKPRPPTQNILWQTQTRQRKWISQKKTTHSPLHSTRRWHRSFPMHELVCGVFWRWTRTSVCSPQKSTSSRPSGPRTSAQQVISGHSLSILPCRTWRRSCPRQLIVCCHRMGVGSSRQLSGRTSSTHRAHHRKFLNSLASRLQNKKN